MRRALLVVVALAALLAPPPALAQWKAGGVRLPITPLDDWQALFADGQGGAYFLFIPIIGPRRVLAQHVLADGSIDPLDGTTGQLVVPTPYGVGHFNAVADGFAGALVTFQRCAPPQPHTPCYETAQNRIARWQPGGAPSGWPDSGAVIGPSWPSYYAPPLIAAGDGGAIVQLDDALVRWAGDAGLPWTPDAGYAGVRVCTSAQTHRNLAISPDGAGGAWALWDENASYDPNIHEVRYNHVTANGQRAFGGSGELIAALPGLTARQARPDGAGGAFVAWSMPAPRPGGATVDSVLVLRIGPDGEVLWDPNGAPLGPVAWVGLVPCGDDEVAYVSVDANGRRRVQKLSGGAPAWPASPEGIPVGVPGVAPYNLLLQPGANGSLFVAWHDARSGSADPYVTLLDASGQPAPGWTLAGTALASTPDDEVAAGLLPGANANEAIVAWWTPSVYVPLGDLVLQKVTSQGVLAVPPAPPALALAPPWPNPSRDGWTLRFALPEAGRASLELFDVAGRRVWSERVEVGSAGPAQARIEAPGLAEGVYRLRLRTAAGERSRSLVLMR